MTNARGTRGSEHPPYRHLLRALGSWLDEHEMQRFTVLETDEGFLVRMIKDGEHVQEELFAHESLTARWQELMNGRRFFQSEPKEVWPLAGTSHQDGLRALGGVLDEVGAESILLEHLDNGLLVTYLYLNPTEGYQWRKHVSLVDSEHFSKLVTEARGRRQRRGLFRR